MNSKIDITGCTIRNIEIIKNYRGRFDVVIGVVNHNEFDTYEEAIAFANAWLKNAGKIKGQVIRLNNYIDSITRCWFNGKKGSVGSTRWNGDGVGLDLIFTPDAPVAAN